MDIPAVTPPPVTPPAVILVAAAIAALYGWAVVASTPTYPGSIGLNLNALGTDWMVFYGAVQWFFDGNLGTMFDGERFTAYLNTPLRPVGARSDLVSPMGVPAELSLGDAAVRQAILRRVLPRLPTGQRRLAGGRPLVRRRSAEHAAAGHRRRAARTGRRNQCRHGTERVSERGAAGRWTSRVAGSPGTGRGDPR